MSLGRFRCHLLAVVGLLAHAPSPVRAADPPPAIELEVDLTAVARRVVHTKLTIPADPGPLTLYYPKWIPGTHGPIGPSPTCPTPSTGLASRACAAQSPASS